MLARKAGKRRIQFFTKLEAWNTLRKFFHAEKAPEGLTFHKFLQTLQGMTDKRYGRGDLEKKGFTYRTLMVAGMHFMDSYNYDVERVKRCVIHYAAPNGLHLSVLRLQLRPGLPRAHREGILYPVRGAGRDEAPQSAGEKGLRRVRAGAGGDRPASPGGSVDSRSEELADGPRGLADPLLVFHEGESARGLRPGDRSRCPATLRTALFRATAWRIPAIRCARNGSGSGAHTNMEPRGFSTGQPARFRPVTSTSRRFW